MSDWPTDVQDVWAFGALSSIAECCPVADVMIGASLTAGATAWPSANLAMYVPVLVRQPITVYQLGWLNSAVSGNIDVGIYDASKARVVSAGSTAQSGTSAIQLADIADTTLLPGLYYLAQAVDNTTATFTKLPTAAALGRVSGLAQQATAFPLPATATFATFAQTTAPLVFGAIEGATI